MNMGPPFGWYKMLAVNLKIFKYPTWLGSRCTELGDLVTVGRVGRGTSRSAVFMDLISLPRKTNNKSEWLNNSSSSSSNNNNNNNNSNKININRASH